MGKHFTIQTIGRIHRMPDPLKGHYDIDVLDNADPIIPPIAIF